MYTVYLGIVQRGHSREINQRRGTVKKQTLCRTSKNMLSLSMIEFILVAMSQHKLLFMQQKLPLDEFFEILIVLNDLLWNLY